MGAQEPKSKRRRSEKQAGSRRQEQESGRGTWQLTSSCVKLRPLHIQTELAFEASPAGGYPFWVLGGLFGFPSYGDIEPSWEAALVYMNLAGPPVLPLPYMDIWVYKSRWVAGASPSTIGLPMRSTTSASARANMKPGQDTWNFRV